MVDGYSRLDIQIMMVNAVSTLHDVLNGNRPGKFKETVLNEIKIIASNFDRTGLNAFIHESESYDYNQLRTVLNLSKKWMSLLGLDIPQPTDAIVREELGPHYQQTIDPKVNFLLNLAIDVDEKNILPNNENGNNYWFLTDDGYLEFHGGGHLRNSYGEIMSSYNGTKTIGKDAIQGGLTEILERAMDGAELTDEYVIGLMTEAGMRFRTKNPDNIHDMDRWYWDLRENLAKNEVRRIKLPDEVAEYYKQFEPGWKRVEGGGFLAETDPYDASYPHAGEDWVWRENNQNKTIGQPVYSPVEGVVKEAKHNKKLGYFIRITLEDGGEFNLFHLQKGSIKVKDKDPVKVGDHLANAGDTGTACTGPHLHMEVRYVDRDNASIVDTPDADVLNRYNRYYVDPTDIQ